MAEIILTSIINKSAEIVGNLLVQQGSRLYWLKEDINWLQREMRHIRSYIDDAKAKAVGGDSRMKNLMNDIQELASDMEDLLDEFLPKIQESHRSKGQLGCLKKVCILCPASFFDKFAMEIEKIKRRVADIDRARTTYNIMDTSNNNNQHDYIIPLDRRRVFLHADDTEVIGLDDDFNMLQAKLLDQDMRYGVISIVGMPGLGKTTLAKKLYRHVRDQFECSALAYASQKPRVGEILLNIAKQVGLAEEDRKDNLENKLQSLLKRKRYVILLDDVWDVEIWDDLKLVLPEFDSKAGSKIIITSRNSSVGKYIGGNSSIHILEPLDSNNSFELFTKKIFTFENNNWASAPPTLENIGREIVRRCGGIPLTIVVTAGILRTRERTEHAWNRVLESMSHKIEDGCAKILALSYNDLPTALRPCFLYFGLFPEDYEICVFNLTNMWIAEKFIVVGSGNRRDAEDMAEDFLSDLVSRNLIQVARRTYEGRIASCRIHDLLHSLCVVLAKENNFFHTKDNTSGDPDNVARLRRITLYSDNVTEFFSSSPKPEKLRVLCCFTNDPRTFSLMTPLNLKLLQVLVVVLPQKLFQLVTIPNEIGNMSYLRYLRFEGYIIGKLPRSIVKLKCLETLDVRNSLIRLPLSVLELQQLRNLLVRYGPASNGCFSIRQFFPINMSLPNLQTLLWVHDTFIHQGLKLHQLTNLRKLGLESVSSSTVKIFSSPQPILPNLEVLKLKFDFITSDKIKRQQINLSSYQNLLELHLSSFQRGSLYYEAFPPNLVKLTLCSFRVDDHLLAALKKLPKLRILKLYHCTHNEVMDLSGDADSFQQLEVLHIEEPNGLSSVIVDDVSVPKLNKVVLKDVHNEIRLSERAKNMTIQSMFNRNAFHSGHPLDVFGEHLGSFSDDDEVHSLLVL